MEQVIWTSEIWEPSVAIMMLGRGRLVWDIMEQCCAGRRETDMGVLTLFNLDFKNRQIAPRDQDRNGVKPPVRKLER
jgi:hypothetical protein